MSETTRAQIRQAVHHPVTWWRGDALLDEQLHPWEGGIQFFAEGLKGFMNGYTGIKDRLYIGMGKGKITPNTKSISDVITITWDGINDPLVGAHMDRRRFSQQVHRWVMRFNATLSPLLILAQCFNFGLTPVQRLIQWTIISFFADIMSTANAVSESKIWAGTSPHSEQRGVLQLWKTLGGHVAGALGGIPYILMGLKDTLGITDYQIMIWGALIFTPLTIFCRWLPSYAKQRVDFTVKVKGEDETEEEAKRPPTLRESFAVVRHNRWFIMWTVVNFVRLFIPKTDELLFYRFLLPKLRLGGKEYGGELLYTLKGILTGLPGFILSPLAIRAVNLFGGKINFIKAHVIVIMIMRSTVFFVGYQSWPRLLYMFVMDAVKNVMDMWSPIPHRMMDYEMFDYVEWKTGIRSEGMTNAVDGMINKLIKNNIGSVFSNAVLQWTQYQGWDIPLEKQPQRFLKSIWPLMHVGVFFGEVIVLVALFLFKYPHDPKEVEADLIERRKLAQQLKEQAEV